MQFNSMVMKVYPSLNLQLKSMRNERVRKILVFLTLINFLTQLFLFIIDSVRAWKEKNKFGEFDPEGQKRKEEKEKEIIEQSTTLARNFQVKLTLFFLKLSCFVSLRTTFSQVRDVK